MSGGPKYEYRWQDNDKYKKPTVLSATDYITELMQWIEHLINDESVFPTKVGMLTLYIENEPNSLLQSCFI